MSEEMYGHDRELRDADEQRPKLIRCSDRMCGADDCPNCHPEYRPQCEHDWKYIADWGGDSDVIGGTFDCSRLECRNCGEESTDEALLKQYEPREEP